MTSQPFNEFIVKVASRCNLNCDYCYEFNLGDESWKQQPKRMTESTARALGRRIAEHAAKHAIEQVFVSLHGGEVLLLGSDRLAAICEALRAEITPRTGLQLTMQTNAVLMSSAYIDVIKRFNIGVSISIDGDAAAHDRHRKDHHGRGSHAQVVQGIKLLLEASPEHLIGFLSVIDVRTDPVQILDSVAAFGVESVDFLLPHHNWDNRPPRPDGDPVAYGKWYWALYQAWTADRHPDVRIRVLTNIVSQLVGGASVFEDMTLAPATLVTIATDGSIEGVDSLKSTATGLQRLGLNIHEHDFDSALNHPLVQLRQSGAAQLCATCLACEFKRECAGGYFPHRWRSHSDFDNPSVYCSDLYWLVSQIKADLLERRRRRAALRNRSAG